MTQIDIIGYLAGACLLMMAAAKTQSQMRAFNMAACVFYVAYGLMIDSMPVLIINAIMIGLHAFRLTQQWLQRRDSMQTS